jgi:uncharacterized protein YecT (DUF1311 family)
MTRMFRRSKLAARFCAGLIAALCIRSSGAPAYEAVCDVCGPAEMRSCLAETIPRTEAELQKTYDLVASVGGAKDKELLEKSQAAWLAYRESECALEGDATRGGSLQLILGAQCWVRLTRQRIRDLADHADMAVQH